MKKKKAVIQFVKTSTIVVSIAIASPLVLAKLGFWGSSQAAEPAPQASAASSPIRSISFADAIEKAMPSVVSIQSTKALPRDLNPLMRDPTLRQYFGDLRGQQPEVQSGLGSGVIVTKDGYILTNNHVIQDADEITVKLSDGRQAKVKVIGSDPETDLAILKSDLKDIVPIAIGNSDKIRVGDSVLAIGNPFGVGQTATHGIVSGMHRKDLGITTFENFIQTDAAINPGNSGGALIDDQGNLIGINNSIYSRSGGFQGIGFAIPINLAKEIMDELIGQGYVTRGWLGITVAKLTDELRKSINYPKGEGAVIAGIIRGGPAANAGLRPGDVIIALDGKAMNDANEVLSATARLKPETAYPITVVRNSETLDFRVVMGKRPTKQANGKPAQPSNQQGE